MRPAALGLTAAGFTLAGLTIALPALAASAPPPCTPLSLASRVTTPAAGDVYLRAGAASCDTIELEVAAHGLGGIFTVAFDLAYPSALLRYEGYSQGTLLLRGPPSQAPMFLVRESSPGTLQVSMTRFAPDPAVSASTSEGLVRLRFHRVAAGEGNVDFIADDTSAIPERVVDGQGKIVAARFTPGHGATITVP